MSNNKTSNISLGTIVLMVSIGLNGLLGGFVIANKTGPKTPDLHIDVSQRHRTPPKDHSVEALKGKRIKRTMRLRMAYDHPQALIAHLEPSRRKEVMMTAMKNVNDQTTHKSHELLMQLRKSHKKTVVLLKQETLDEENLKIILKHNRVLKEKLAVQGDVLIIEILKQLTPEERQGAAMSLDTAKRKRFKRKRKDGN